MAMPIAKSSPMLLVPLPSGAVANMSGVLHVCCAGEGEANTRATGAGVGGRF